MQITMQDNQLFVTGSSRFSARQTFTCGQCFRWTEQPDGSYLGIVRGLPARVSDQDGALVLSSDEQQFAQLWRGYFDCDTDYAAICDSFAIDAFTAAAADFGRGIRILRQEPSAALRPLSSRNATTSPAHHGSIVDRLCTLLGEPISFEQQTLYAFPAVRNSSPSVHRRIWHLCAQATARRISSPPHRPSAPAQLIFPPCPVWTRTPPAAKSCSCAAWEEKSRIAFCCSVCTSWTPSP